jgi:hypothetical protein
MTSPVANCRPGPTAFDETDNPDTVGQGLQVFLEVVRDGVDPSTSGFSDQRLLGAFSFV